MNETVAALREREAKLQGKVARAQTQLQASQDELDEVRTAIKVLARMGLVEEGAASAPASDLSDAQRLVLKFVPEGADAATPPKHVFDLITVMGDVEISPDYVRTALWRLAKRGVINSKNGLYWRETEEAPDAETSEASETTGPVTGRERGYPPSTPEGSIPSGSTHVQAGYDTSLDDDVPF